MGRFIAVCVSPAIDRNYVLDSLSPGTLHRAPNPSITAGGKGVNAARVLALLGEKPILLGFAAGESGRFLLRELQKVGVRTHLTGISGETRFTLNLLDRSTGHETEITESGPTVGAESLLQFLFHFEDTVESGDLVVLSGGVPEGVPIDLYAQLIRIAHGKGARCVLDTGAASLHAALPEKPDLVKPNVKELSALCGRPLRLKREIIEAVRSLGIACAAVSMGDKGALLVTRESAWHASALPVSVQSTIGSGDALTAGLALGMHRKMPWKKALAFATACAASNASRVEVGTVDPVEVEAWTALVKVRKVPCRKAKR
jgi:1-phosphofructokinase family hexose kinase